MSRTRPLALALCLLASGCGDSLGPPSGEPTGWQPSTIPVDALLSFPEAVEIGGRSHVLTTELWRDLMPTVPVGPSSGLAARVRIAAQDSADVSAPLEADRIWAVNGREALEAKLAPSVDPPRHPLTLQRIAVNGPAWDTGIRVDIVVRVFVTGEPARYLRASNQLIHAVH